MKPPNQILVRFYFAEEGEGRMRDCLGWYVQTDLMVSPSQVQMVVEGYTLAVIIKQIKLDTEWFQRSRYDDSGEYDGTTLYVYHTVYATAREIYFGILRASKDAKRLGPKPPMPRP